MYSALEAAYPVLTAPRCDHEISIVLARLLFLMFGDDTEMWQDQQGEPVPDAFLEFIHVQTPADASTLGNNSPNCLRPSIRPAAPQHAG